MVTPTAAPPSSETNKPFFSVVIPVFNEEDNISSLVDELILVMSGLGKPYEILFVDDGSSDQTWTLIKEATKAHPEIQGFSLSRNFGHQPAVYAGLCHAQGAYVGIMDGDGQDPPQALGQMFEKIMGGGQVVYGVRKNRKEGKFKKTCYFIFYRMLSRIADIPIPLDSGDFSVMDRKVVEFIKSVEDPLPYIRGLRSWFGGKQIPLPYERPARKKGVTKYSFFKLIDLAVSGITSCSKLPLRFSIYLGFTVALITFLYILVIVILKTFFNFLSSPFHTGWTSLIAVIGFLGGMNLLMMGVIGEYLSHVFDSAKRLPPFIIQETARPPVPDKPETL